MPVLAYNAESGRTVPQSEHQDGDRIRGPTTGAHCPAEITPPFTLVLVTACEFPQPPHECALTGLDPVAMHHRI